MGEAKLTVLGLLVLSSACSVESVHEAPETTTSDSGTTSLVTGSDGSAPSSNSTTSSSSVGGANGSDGASTTASTTGGSGADCSGAFGEPTLLFSADTTGIPQSFTLTPDELQLYYVLDGTAGRFIERRTRAATNAAFGAAEAVPELLEVCPTLGAALHVGTVDLSPDGLTAYFTCEELVELPTTLVLATRTALAEPFVPDPTVRGMVGASFASADGLEAFANTPTDLVQLERHQRSSLTVPFSAAEPLGISLRSADPSNDGLWLFGSVLVEGSTNDSQLAAAQRADLSAPFGEPSTEGFPVPPVGVSYLTPTISADCRSLYFLRIEAASGASQLMLAQR